MTGGSVPRPAPCPVGNITVVGESVSAAGKQCAAARKHSTVADMTASEGAADARRTVDQIAEDYVTDLAALDPFVATSVGVGGYDALSTDYSPDGFAARAELDRRTLAALRTVAFRDERERVAGEAMTERLQAGLDMADVGLDRSLNNLEFPLHAARLVFDLMPGDTEEEWRNIAARVRDFPSVMDSYRQTLQRDIATGHPPARRQAEVVAGQFRRLASEGFFRDLVANGPEGMRAELERAATAAGEAYQDFADYLTREVAPRARTEDAVGRQRYEVASRYFLGATVDLDETYAWGLQELHRIEAEMADVAGRIAGGSVDDAVAALRADEKRTLHGVPALREWMQELADRTIAELHGTHFDIPEPIRTIECVIAPTRDGGIYYVPPTEDLGRPGRMCWSVPEGVQDFQTWQQKTVVMHEGVPGHHLQCAGLVYDARFNRWQRLLSMVSGHAEGWALYAERLMADLGYLDDPADRLGMLDEQGFRAARVVVDIGLHLGLPVPRELVRSDGLDPGPWTPDKAFVFLQRHSRMPVESLRFELDRYLGWPGQAPSYKVGERIWLRAREEARQRKGADFDLKAFHRAALDLGSLGLDPLQDALRRL